VPDLPDQDEDTTGWWRWPAIVVGLLVFSLMVHGVLVAAALAGGGPKVEDDYYRKAANWDQHMAQERRNEALGWQVELVVPAASQGRRRVEVRLRDSQGSGLEGAAVRLVAFHNAYAHDVQRADLEPLGEGAYAVSLPLPRAGRSRFDLEVTRGDERFTFSEQRFVP
jgi:nitrogen fixation protein FixH